MNGAGNPSSVAPGLAAFWRLDPTLFGRHDGSGQPDDSSYDARLLLPPASPVGTSRTFRTLNLGPLLRNPGAIEPSILRVAVPPITGPAPRGVALATFGGGAEEPAIVESEAGIVFTFDPEAAIVHVLQERYYTRRRPFYTRLPFNYHRLLPASVRSLIRGLYNRSARSAAPADQFPAWPWEHSIESLRAVVRIAAARVSSLPLADPPSWPGGKRYAVALTHDVDGGDGQAEIPSIAELEHTRNLPAAWYLPTHRYPLDHALLDELRAAGHEIGCHDWNHDNRTSFLSTTAIRRRLAACREMLERHDATGYRAPSLMRSPQLFKALAEEGFSYDTSVGDSERLLQCADASGCATVFPFVRDGILEIPCTQPLENILLYMGMDHDQLLSCWKLKLNAIRDVGGIAVFTTHADPHFSGNPAMLRLYARLLDALGEDSNAWMTTPGAIARHWKSTGRDATMTRP